MKLAMVWDVLAVSVIVCYIVDISGIVESVKMQIWKWLFNGKREYVDFSLKPFDCSLCMCFWIGMIWLICQGGFNLFNVLVVCMFSMLSEQITNMLLLVKMSIARLQDRLMTKIG